MAAKSKAKKNKQTDLFGCAAEHGPLYRVIVARRNLDPTDIGAPAVLCLACGAHRCAGDEAFVSRGSLEENLRYRPSMPDNIWPDGTHMELFSEPLPLHLLDADLARAVATVEQRKAAEALANQRRIDQLRVAQEERFWAKGRGCGDIHGPLGWREEAMGSAWRLIAEQIRQPSGLWPWDVYALHVGGNRVPPGPNVHSDPGAEMSRIRRVYDAPAR